MSTFSDELGRLRKGRGIMAADLQQRLGPTLRAMASIDDHCSPAETWRRLAGFLSDLAAKLPGDLRLALTAALALSPEWQLQFLEDRMELLAERLQRDVRTARRRVDEAMAAAEQAVSGPEPPGSDYAPEGWYLGRFGTKLHLEGSQPIAIEERTIVATVDDLDEVLVSTSVPRCEPRVDRPHNANFALLYGGTLARQEQSSATYFRYFIRLPRPLACNESHKFGVSIAIPPGQRMNPRYAFKPLRRCDEFDLRIKFGNAPRGVWELTGLPQGMVDDYTADDSAVLPDSDGEIHLSYRYLRVGLVYGARWENLAAA